MLTSPKLASMIRQKLAEGPPVGGWPKLTPEAAARIRWIVGPYAMHPNGHAENPAGGGPVAGRAPDPLHHHDQTRGPLPIH